QAGSVTRHHHRQAPGPARACKVSRAVERCEPRISLGHILPRQEGSTPGYRRSSELSGLYLPYGYGQTPWPGGVPKTAPVANVLAMREVAVLGGGRRDGSAGGDTDC